MEIKTLLANSLYQLLRPVARIAMRHGLTTRDFHDIAKKAFVDVAREAYGIGGRPTNKSRVAALTGLTRAEVARLVDLNGEGSDERLGGRHPLNRVVTHWLRGADWTDADGQPRELLVEGESGSFSALVRAVGCDLPWQTLLRELQRMEIVERRDESVRLCKRGFIPGGGEEADRIPFLGENAAALVDTIDHNLRGDEPRIERKLVFRGLDEAGCQRLEALVREQGQQWLEFLNNDIGATSAEDPGQDRFTGVGLYYFDMTPPEGGPYA